MAEGSGKSEQSSQNLALHPRDLALVAGCATGYKSGMAHTLLGHQDDRQLSLPKL